MQKRINEIATGFLDQNDEMLHLGDFVNRFQSNGEPIPKTKRFDPDERYKICKDKQGFYLSGVTVHAEMRLSKNFGDFFGVLVKDKDYKEFFSVGDLVNIVYHNPRQDKSPYFQAKVVDYLDQGGHRYNEDSSRYEYYLEVTQVFMKSDSGQPYWDIGQKLWVEEEFVFSI